MYGIFMPQSLCGSDRRVTAVGVTLTEVTAEMSGWSKLREGALRRTGSHSGADGASSAAVGVGRWPCERTDPAPKTCKSAARGAFTPEELFFSQKSEAAFTPNSAKMQHFRPPCYGCRGH